MATAPPVPDAAAVQAGLFEFAIGELVRQHRGSFAPLWSVESWAKLLIWLALNSGCSGEREALEGFATALSPALTARMRRLFFERELEEAGLRLLADPAEAQVLVMPLPGASDPFDRERLEAALAPLGLLERVVEPARWQRHDQLLALPWREAACA